MYWSGSTSLNFSDASMKHHNLWHPVSQTLRVTVRLVQPLWSSHYICIHLGTPHRSLPSDLITWPLYFISPAQTTAPPNLRISGLSLNRLPCFSRPSRYKEKTQLFLPFIGRARNARLQNPMLISTDREMELTLAKNKHYHLRSDFQATSPTGLAPNWICYPPYPIVRAKQLLRML